MVESISDGSWRVDPGLYEIRVANSSADIAHSSVVTVSNGSTHASTAGGL
jgi:hypothetical protein